LAQGLKVAQHGQDDMKGFVVHTSCFMASGLPIGIVWKYLSDGPQHPEWNNWSEHSCPLWMDYMAHLCSLPHNFAWTHNLAWIGDTGCLYYCLIFLLLLEPMFWAW